MSGTTATQTATPLAVGVHAKYYQVGDFLYGRRANKEAEETLFSHIANYSNDAIGAFRAEKLVDIIPKWINEIRQQLGHQRSEELEAISKLGNKAWTAMAIPRLIGCIHSTMKGIQERRAGIEHPGLPLEQPLAPDQALRRDVDLVNTGFDAVAITGYVTAMVAGCFKATASLVTPVVKAADACTLIHDSADLVGSVQDATRAHQVESSLIRQGQQKTSDIVVSFHETKKSAALRVVKAAVATIGGILGVGIMLGVLKISALVLVTLSLLTQIFAIAIALHKKQMTEKPIEMLEAFDTSRAANQISRPQQINMQQPVVA